MYIKLNVIRTKSPCDASPEHPEQKNNCESSLLQLYVLVSQLPLVVIIIMTAAKEGVRRSTGCSTKRSLLESSLKRKVNIELFQPTNTRLHSVT